MNTQSPPSSARLLHRDVAILGGGFGGLGMAIQLRRRGHDNFVLLESEDGLGGTWRVNTYPGAACDVQSHLYSYSFAPKPDWSRTFGDQKEILRYIESCADRFGVRRYCRFGERVTSANWEPESQRWRVETAQGTTVLARVVVSATGGLSQPATPKIPGLDDFAGTVFHSARWRHDVPLEGKRVGVIGTGASAIQIVPEVAKSAAHLTVFQRTAPWILPRPDHAYPRWMREAFRASPPLRWLERQRIYWSLEPRALAFTAFPDILRWIEPFALMHLCHQVPKGDLRDALTPNFRLGCKRILMSNTYYPTLQLDHVSVETDGIQTVVHDGIRLNQGQHRPLDVLILATGFEAAEAKPPFPVTGRNGCTLEDVWTPHAQAYKGTTVAGFPNLFLLVGPNTGLGHSSMIHIIESQLHYVLSALDWMSEQGRATVEVGEPAQHAWNEALQRKLAKTVWASGCNAWYSTRDGVNTTLWPGTTLGFRRELERFDGEHYASS